MHGAILVVRSASQIARPLMPSDIKRMQEDKVSMETVAEERFWRKRPDGIAFRISTKPKSGVVFCILEYKRMSDVRSWVYPYNI